MKEKLEKTKGITLIALVVTIVVLIILAGITIGTLTGDNSVVKEARSAKEQTEREALEEQINEAIIIAEQKYGNPTLEQVIKEIKKIDTVKDVKVNGDIEDIWGDIITGKLDDYIKISDYIKVGDYVNYDPTITDKEGTKVEGNKLKYTSQKGTIPTQENEAITHGNGFGERRARFYSKTIIRTKMESIKSIR